MKNFDRHDIKLSTVKTNYYFNGKNVTCKLEAEIKLPTVFWRVLSGGAFDLISFDVQATARCSNDDKYIRDKGMKIALAKAENKAYKKALYLINEELNELWENLEAFDSMFNAFGNKGIRSIKHNIEYINRISNEPANKEK